MEKGRASGEPGTQSYGVITMPNETKRTKQKQSKQNQKSNTQTKQQTNTKNKAAGLEQS